MDVVRTPPMRDTRRRLRRPTSLNARMAASNLGRFDVEVTDLSSDGCRLRSPFHFEAGDTLVLTFPFLAPLGSTVCWCDAECVGLRFNRPLHDTVVDMLVGVRRH